MKNSPQHLHVFVPLFTYQSRSREGLSLSVMGIIACLPVNVTFDGRTLQSKDPLPLAGHACHDTAVEDLTALARLLNVPMPNLTRMLPRCIFESSGDMLSHVQRTATELSEVAVVRIVSRCYVGFL